MQSAAAHVHCSVQLYFTGIANADINTITLFTGHSRDFISDPDICKSSPLAYTLDRCYSLHASSVVLRFRTQCDVTRMLQLSLMWQLSAFCKAMWLVTLPCC